MINTRQKQAIETKKKLLKAAEAVFFEQGFQQTTIRHIISRAQTGYGTAYVYFKNKDDFLIELMKEVMEQFYEVASLPFTPSTKKEAQDLIVNQVRLFLSLAMERKEFMRIIKEAIGNSPVIEANWQNIRDRFISSITQDILYAQSKSLANPQLIPSLVARSWFYTNEMFMWELINGDSAESMEEIIQHMTVIYTNGLYSSH
ncbi:TetR/AcrR family transcriptional regulator [Domibacillus robiginosus]|uniref:TetR/AcrR family transcriptional regulator n=1 Tax=Domibacillus robiginosus TaxID=1071054 RepID=UPI00067BFDF5|nr:TetR/AcrR family transcriptional regulator [Domibacillus robiginosus]